MSKIHLVLALSLIVAVSATSLGAEPAVSGTAEEASLEVLLNAIRSNRKALVAASLMLTDEEAAKFWPVYDRYQKEIIANGDQALAVTKDYIGSIQDASNAKALKLVEDYLAAEADRVQLRRAFIPEFAAVLPGRKLARLYQIENKMDAVARYDLASTIPVIEEQPAAPKGETP